MLPLQLTGSLQAAGRLGMGSLARLAVCPLRPKLHRRHTVIEMGRRSAKIANRKGKSDAIKTKLYAKYGKKIAQQVKAGGPDFNSNSKLADMVKTAKDAGVPVSVIERNIKNASDKTSAEYTEAVYEAYGPGGTGFIIECLTDNLNRTATEVKTAINKSGCKPAEIGSVMFNFQRVGQIVVLQSTEDAVFEAAMEAGCEDFAPINDESGAPTNSYKVFAVVDAFAGAKQKLLAAGLKLDMDSTDLVFKSTNVVEVDDEAYDKCEGLIERLLELDDVDAVYTNCEGLSG